MKITKFGHSCLFIETAGKRILTDPGNYASGFEHLTGIDLFILTHEHLDHVDPSTFGPILAQNSDARIITNHDVRAVLEKEGIRASFEIVEDGQTYQADSLEIRAYGKEHAVLHSSLPCIHNTGYSIGNLFHPGDAFPVPKEPVDVLALPVAAPWMRVAETIDYALKIRPQKVIAIHDGALRIPGGNHRLPKEILEPAGIPFHVLENGKEYIF